MMKYCHGWLKFEWEIHLISDNTCNIVILYVMPNLFLQGMIITVGQQLVLMTLHRGLQIALSNTVRIGETKYHI